VTGYPFLEHPGPIPFAHRGGAGDHPENTLAAFEAAVRLGYRYVETDVHATADGVLLAFHDDRLERVTDGHGAVADLPYDVVARARVAGHEPIPLLEELLATWPDLRVNVDPKADSAVAPLIEAIRRTGAVERVCVGSFSGRRIARVRAAFGPRLCTSLGPRGVAALRAVAWRARPLSRLVAAEGAACVQVPVRQGRIPLVDGRFVAAAHRLGLAVHAWTIDDADEMTRLLDLGLDGLMTDRPAVLRDVLLARGQWHGGWSGTEATPPPPAGMRADAPRPGAGTMGG
jgi:glycerophosphoryl diester phosphodiesterase